MEKYAILAIDEDTATWRNIGNSLKNKGFDFHLAVSHEESLEKLEKLDIHLVLLDDSLPDVDFLEMIRDIKASRTLPLFVVSQRDNPSDVITSIELGADDYIYKPVNVHELAARIKSQLKLLRDVRREVREEVEQQVLRGLAFGGFELDFHRHELRTREGDPVGLTSGELEILVALAKSAGKVLSREQLFIETRGRDSDSFDRAVDVQISRIRQKMNGNSDGDTDYIKTVRGVGYMLDVKPTPLFE